MHVSGRSRCGCNKLPALRWIYLSGPLLGKLFGQVTPDASSPTGDQNHLLGQILPPAWQQRRQTCSDYIVDHLNREKKHTTRAPELHLGKRRRPQLNMFAASSQLVSSPTTAQTERLVSSCKFSRMQTISSAASPTAA